MNFENSFNDQPRTPSLNTLILKSLLFVSFTYQTPSNETTVFKRKNVKALQFPMKNILVFLRKTEKKTPSTDIPPTQFLPKLKR